MTQEFLTIVVPFTSGDPAKVERRIAALGHPATPAVRAKLEAVAVHFMSMLVVRGARGDDHHLILEAYTDDDQTDALARALHEELHDILRACGVQAGDGDLARFLKQHRWTLDQALLGRTGLDFSGTPGLALARIRENEALATGIEAMPELREPGTAIDVLDRIRGKLWAEGRKDLFVPERVECLQPPRRLEFWRRGPWATARSAVIKLLWPLGVAAVALAALFVVPGWRANRRAQAVRGLLPRLGLLALLFRVARLTAVLWVVLAAAAAAIVYFWLGRKQREDVSDDAAPDVAHFERVTAHENQPDRAQNLFAAVSSVKPGWLRWLTLRLGLYSVWWGVAFRSRPGFIDTLGAIHVARWVVLPGKETDQVVFFSHYSGSWESYLEDFVARVSQGLNVIWSNMQGYPRTWGLFRGGASDGDRLKRWARRQQVPTWFCYSAYPQLTTQRIRTAAAIRDGIATARTEGAARAWLARFGVHPAPRPARSAPELEEISTLVQGKQRQLAHGMAVFVRFSAEARERRQWLDTVRHRLSYGPLGQAETACVLALTASGLDQLGLPANARSTFTPAFLQGSADPGRAQVVGDVGKNGPDQWTWGNEKHAVDALLLLFARKKARLDALRDEVVDELASSGQRIVHTLSFTPLTDDFPREPFGFADGVSQPKLRGVHVRMDAEGADVLETGEFVFGYPDETGNFPPSPRVPANTDREGMLDPMPSSPTLSDPYPQALHAAWRDLGRNGTFLVVRQLEQDARAFDDCLQSLASDPCVPGRDLQERKDWVAARLIGRWKNGASVVKYPDTEPAHGDRDNRFLYQRDDPDGARCPIGAHVRRANPRDMFDADAPHARRTVERHRIRRVGRRYGPEDPIRGNEPAGMLFICLSGDIERQFEFVQQTWLLGSDFGGLGGEADPLLGCEGRRFSFRGAEGRKLSDPLQAFVTVKGGGYFFLPGRKAMRYLAALGG
jgi:Dyp-type peroxidase family